MGIQFVQPFHTYIQNRMSIVCFCPLLEFWRISVFRHHAKCFLCNPQISPYGRCKCSKSSRKHQINRTVFSSGPLFHLANALSATNACEGICFFGDKNGKFHEKQTPPACQTSTANERSSSFKVGSINSNIYDYKE